MEVGVEEQKKNINDAVWRMLGGKEERGKSKLNRIREKAVIENV